MDFPVPCADDSSTFSLFLMSLTTSSCCWVYIIISIVENVMLGRWRVVFDCCFLYCFASIYDGGAFIVLLLC